MCAIEPPAYLWLGSRMGIKGAIHRPNHPKRKTRMPHPRCGPLLTNDWPQVRYMCGYIHCAYALHVITPRPRASITRGVECAIRGARHVADSHILGYTSHSYTFRYYADLLTWAYKRPTKHPCMASAVAKVLHAAESVL